MRVRGRMPRIGTRKLYYLLKKDIDSFNIKLGRDCLFNFLRAEHLLIKPKRNYIKTTNSKHWMRKYPNQSASVSVNRPEQLWVSDITYIKTALGHSYLSLVTDAYSKRIMGYELLESLSVEGPINAIRMAFKNRKYNQPLMHHSDRGLQYCSADYIKELTENGIAVSMTENGDPYENAVAERINGILKYEFLLTNGFKNHLEAINAIKQSITIYNQDRPHLSCQMLTPMKMHDQHIIPLKKWPKKVPSGLNSGQNLK